uniref:Uncharacterized protein n=1 Tax=Rhizophora mucronata TaxID=61149 RepID=A0A2P2M4S4_RHIMU
MERRRGHL